MGLIFVFIYICICCFITVLSKLLIVSINTTFFIFQNGGHMPSWIFKSLKFQQLVWFIEIAETADLWYDDGSKVK